MRVQHRYRLFTAAVILVLLAPYRRSPAHDVITTKLTYSRDISRIFARRCVSCHGSGSTIPLSSYEETRPWAVAIKEQVLARSMPPWGAVKGFGNFRPDAALNQSEIMIISAWVLGGAPQGDPSLLAQRSPRTAAYVPPAVLPGGVFSDRSTIRETMHAAALRPLGDSAIDSARITARLPTGVILPLIWLYHYDPKSPQRFLFAEPLELPKGTLIESTAKVRFALDISAQ